MLYNCSSNEKVQGKPNVVIVLVDDMGYSDPGCFGGEVHTPNIDNLAANGIRFTHFYNTGRCWPTRASIMTGYYAQAVRMDPPSNPSPEWAFTIPDYLKPMGYRCYHSGKWHIRNKPQPVKDAGFDHSYLLTRQDNFFSWPHDLDGINLPSFEPDDNNYSTTVITNHALDFLKEHASAYKENPFFLYLAYTAPHFPVQALREDIDKYRGIYDDGWDKIRGRRHERMINAGLITTGLSEREPSVNVTYEHLMPDHVLLDSLGAGEVLFPVDWESLTQEQKDFQASKMAIHAAMVDRVDQEIGRLIVQLKSMDAFQNTILFFLSDNGASAEIMIRGSGHDPDMPMGSAYSYLCLGPGYASAANTPFRRYKHWNHEGGIATPLIVHWPEGIRDRGIIRENPGHVVDLLPTVLQLAGGEFTDTRNGMEVPALHGKSLIPAFYEDHSVDPEFIFFSHRGNRALRMGKWKIVSAAIDDDKWFLYDLSTDRAEQNDLSKEYPEQFKAMISKWEEKFNEYNRMAENKASEDPVP
jgi:arylsulfatase